MLAGREGPLLDLLEKIGESLGFIFQLKDDEIGLFGSEEDTGKPAGSDIKENKKSLYHYYLFQRADSSARERLSGIFGSPEITPAGLEYVKNLALKLGIPKTIENKISVFRNETEGLLGSITGADPDYITIMHELLDYSVRRKK
jgi:geranylgeranyl diphosphate synthase type I